MLSPANGEQIHLVNYVEDYLDSIESLPFDLQRNVSLMREIDAKYQGSSIQRAHLNAKHFQTSEETLGERI